MIINDTLPYEVDSGLLSNVGIALCRDLGGAAGKGLCVMSLCDR